MPYTINSKSSLKELIKCVLSFQFCAQLAASLLYTAQLLGTLNIAGVMLIIAVQVRTPIAEGRTIFRNWRFDERENQLEIIVESGVVPRYEVLGQPWKIAIALPDTDIGSSVRRTYSGAVRQIRINQLPSRVGQIVMELSPDVILAPQQVQVQKVQLDDGKTRWIFRPAIVRERRFPAPQIIPSGSLPARLPPATFHQINNLPRVTVPPVNRSQQGNTVSATFRDRQPTATATPNSLGSASSLVTQPASISESPELIRRSPAPTLSQEPSTIVPVIDFGQPLPRKSLP